MVSGEYFIYLTVEVISHHFNETQQRCYQCVQGTFSRFSLSHILFFAQQDTITIYDAIHKLTEMFFFLPSFDNT